LLMPQQLQYYRWRPAIKLSQHAPTASSASFTCGTVLIINAIII
jgi:hypothetical protein